MSSPACRVPRGYNLWLALALMQTFLVITSEGYNRRTLTGGLSKGGWRPVVGQGPLLLGSLNTLPLHAQPSYKIPIAVDPYKARPISTRDANKLNTQTPRPPTPRTSPSLPIAHQPINTYHYPFAQQQPGSTDYKYVENFGDNVIVKNFQNPYAARPVFSKYTNKFNQPIFNAFKVQQLPNMQPIRFAHGASADIFGKPVEVYIKPDGSKKKPTTITEIYKTEVYKIDSDTAPQSLSQVKTAQQQNLPTAKLPSQSYQQFGFPEIPQSIYGTYGTYNAQPQNRQQVLPGNPSKSSYFPPQPTKTTFNSFSYTPNYKSTPSQFTATTPKLYSTVNHINYGNFNEYKTVPTQQTKLSTPSRIENVSKGVNFRASPQDPFIKQHHTNYADIPVTTYNPVLQTTTIPYNYYNNFNYPSEQSQPNLLNYYGQHFNDIYETKKPINDHPKVVNKPYSQQYVNPINDVTPSEAPRVNTPALRQTYEVTEHNADINTQSTPWTVTPTVLEPSTYATESTTRQHHTEVVPTKPTTSTTVQALHEEYSFVPEPEHGYDNTLAFDSQVESQNRLPVSEDFEPISGPHLKDYYYKFSTPSHEDHKVSRRKNKPIEPSSTTEQEVSTGSTSTTSLASMSYETPLPTVPPNKHFKRPNLEIEEDKQHKRTKLRRRRPFKKTTTTTTTTRVYESSTEPTESTTVEEFYTTRPRIRQGTTKSQAILTTPSVSTDLSTSAIPTITPTIPTVFKKKLISRRPVTTTEIIETTLPFQTTYNKDEANNESPIMKISHRPRDKDLRRNPNFEYRVNETPDYSHKQDEKDTPTSDISIQTNTLNNNIGDSKPFLFHRDIKPIEAKLEPVRVTTTVSTTTSETNNIKSSTPRTENSSESIEKQQPKTKNKFEINRPRFSVKDYRSRMSSTTSTTEKSVTASKLRHPHRKAPYSELNADVETTTERKKFTPKEPRLKIANASENEQTDRTPFKPSRSKEESTTQRISARIRNGSRRTRPTEEPVETPSPTTEKITLRKQTKDQEANESVQDVSVLETTVAYEKKEDAPDRSKSESAIMKIADKKHQEPTEHLFEYTKRVSDLTVAASKDYNKPGMFKTVSANSRRIPNYFTIATDDPILPIEAFFPQINQRKDS